MAAPELPPGLGGSLPIPAKQNRLDVVQAIPEARIQATGDDGDRPATRSSTIGAATPKTPHGRPRLLAHAEVVPHERSANPAARARLGAVPLNIPAPRLALLDPLRQVQYDRSRGAAGLGSNRRRLPHSFYAVLRKLVERGLKSLS